MSAVECHRLSEAPRRCQLQPFVVNATVHRGHVIHDTDTQHPLAAMINWPDGKRFAFSVFDDTDCATMANVPEVYRLLSDLGFRTTKSVWPIRGTDTPILGGDTAQDPAYREWTLSLQAAGFEIGSHGTTFHSSVREDIIRGMDEFRSIYGHDPKTLANHAGCAESIYWGQYRTTGIHRLAYRAMTGFKRPPASEGHLESSPRFWGDACLDRVTYVRNFTYDVTNTLAACPKMPYHDPARPYVAYWFASSEGQDVGAFNARLAESQQDRLEEEGGACIMYTHFASGFLRDGRLDPRFQSLMERLAAKGGWYVPVATLLDHLRAAPGGGSSLTASERRSIERRWLISKARVGHS